MAEKLLFFPLMIDRWLSGVRHLTLEEQGAYLQLLLYLYEGGPPIKDADHVMRILQAAGVQGKNRRSYAKLWAKLSPKFASNIHGSYSILAAKLLKNGGKIKGLDGVSVPDSNQEPVTSTRKEKEKTPTMSSKAKSADQKSTSKNQKINGAKHKIEALEILDFLNEKTGKRFRPVETNLNLIVNRLKEGYTLIECRQVIALKCREWKHNDKMHKFLRPATLFCKANMAQYSGELGANRSTDR